MTSVNTASNNAINTANDAMYHLDQADRLLSKAKGWGIADILGGMMIVSAIKQQKINQVRNEIDIARNSLDALESSLNDMDLTGAPDVFFSDWGFLDMTDIVFDNLLSDVLMQSKLSEAQKNVRYAMDQLNIILDDLEMRSASLQRKKVQK